MDLDDVPDETGLGIAAAVVAALLLSPKARGLMRRGAVTGLAATLTAGDVVAAWARRVTSRALQGHPVDATFADQLAREARQELSKQSLRNEL